MKFLASTLVQAWLLICVLGFYAWSLGHDIGAVKHWRAQEAMYVSSSRNSVFDKPEGVDVYGKHIASSSLTVKKNVVFLLRYDSLQDDLAFWTQVKGILLEQQQIGLIGYCDCHRCVTAIQKMQPPAFPVLASGEVGSVQAVVNADSDGRAIFTRAGVYKQSKKLWRAVGSSPEKTAHEVIQWAQ